MDTSRLTRDTPERLLRQATAELQQQLTAGQPARVEDWLQRLPVVAADEELSLELIYSEYVLREGLGQQPRPEEYYQRFPDLQARLHRLFEVDALLQDSDREKTVVADGASDVRFATLPTGGTSVPVIGLPAAIGDFQPLDRLGSGGMGVVYRARQISLQRLVALKLIREDIAGDVDVRERFLREARIVAQLEHPHIVRIHEAGAHAGRLYLALEYVPGGTLRNCLQGKPLPPRDAAQLVETLAQTMHFAHERNIIHRDLKPANVLLQMDESRLPIEYDTALPATQAACTHLQSALPKVTDFGLAVHLSGQGQLTSLGRVVGTPCYMAPEQAQGKPGWNTPLVDVYALGAILYETLVGKPPFVSNSDLETLRLVAQEEPVSPSRLQPTLPRDLVVICLRCLAKEPHRRYPSAAALAADLRRFRNGEPIQARPAGWMERAGKWMRRHPARATLLVVCLVAVMSLATVIGIYTHWLTEALAESDRQRTLAVAAAEAEGKRRQQARQALDTLTSQIVEDWLLERPSLEPAQREFLEQALRQYETFAAETATDEASRAGVVTAYLRVTSLHTLLGRPKEAEASATRGLELAAVLCRDYPQQLTCRQQHAQGFLRRAIAREALGAWTEAEADFRAAIPAWESLVRDNADNRDYRVQLAFTCSNYSVLLHRQNRLAEAERLCNDARQQWEALLQANPRSKQALRGLSRTLASLGVVQRRQRHPDRVQTLRSAWAVSHRVLRDEPTEPLARFEHSASCMNLAMVLTDQKEHTEAERLLREGLTLLDHLLEDRPTVALYRHDRAKMRNGLGLVLLEQNRLREAELAQREALRELEQLARDHPQQPDFLTSVGGCLADLGNTLQRRRQYPQAEQCFQRAEEILTTQLRQEPRREPARRFLLAVYRNWGTLLETQKRPLEEAALWQRAATWMTEPYVTSSVIEQALALCRGGKYREAVSLVAALTETRLTPLNRDNIAKVYAQAAAGDPEARAAHLERLQAHLTAPQLRPLWTEGAQSPVYVQHLVQHRMWDLVRDQEWFRRVLAEARGKK